MFSDAIELMQLSLDFNPIEINSTGPFLNNSELAQISLKGCNITELFDQTFSNLSGLVALNLAGNKFDEVRFVFASAKEFKIYLISIFACRQSILKHLNR